jgi:hypothetical protein
VSAPVTTLPHPSLPIFDLRTEDNVSRPTTLARRALLAASALALAVVATGCGDSGGSAGGMQVPTTGSVQLAAEFSSSGAPVCSDHSTWSYDPVNLDPSATQGTISHVAHTKSVENIFPSNGICRSTDFVNNLRFGTWRVTWSALLPRSCVIDVRTTNWLTIEQNGNCRTTL